MADVVDRDDVRRRADIHGRLETGSVAILEHIERSVGRSNYEDRLSLGEHFQIL